MLFRTDWRQAILFCSPQTLQLHCARQWWAKMKPTLRREEIQVAQNISPENWVWWFLVTWACSICFLLFSRPEKPPTAKMQKFPLNGEILWSENKLCEILFLDSNSNDCCIFSSVWSQNTTICTVSFVSKMHTQSHACTQSDRVMILVKRLRTFPFVQRPQQQRRQHSANKRLTAWTFHTEVDHSQWIYRTIRFFRRAWFHSPMKSFTIQTQNKKWSSNFETNCKSMAVVNNLMRIYLCFEVIFNPQWNRIGWKYFFSFLENHRLHFRAIELKLLFIKEE